MTPAQLWRRYCTGDAGAFDQVYARYRGPLFRYVRRQCGECTEHEELFQDVWLRAIRKRAQFQGEHLQAWLFGIARNRLIDFHRANGRDLDRDDTDPDAIVSGEMPSGTSVPDRWSLLRDCVERLFALLRDLPLAQRDAFLLREETGMNLQEIAEVTESTRETVKSRLRYATRRLRSGLEDCDD